MKLFLSPSLWNAGSRAHQGRRNGKFSFELKDAGGPHSIRAIHKASRIIEWRPRELLLLKFRCTTQLRKSKG